MLVKEAVVMSGSRPWCILGGCVEGRVIWMRVWCWHGGQRSVSLFPQQDAEHVLEVFVVGSAKLGKGIMLIYERDVCDL